ncbi:L,D-transpeptidase family protein [Litoreibacter albidus]|uniref:L,D-transpeptidase catalytic domain n=1 Tax=Litoreibacter albidus TaxID=670155 RepID=A0A1H2ZJ69_9RHOB|nr:L,D-transpeptidase family protein [Litoreibacter albidus]SDX16759.1 L,D-transpeptidase catalytic domain [Litoreibacter albidus]
MSRLIRISLLIATLAVGVVGYTKVMARVGSGTPPDAAPISQQADEIRVIKSTREMHLLRDGKTIRQYPISLGAAPKGHKSREGDERTPEGTYEIDWRNANSIAHLSLHISYPNAEDIARAKSAGVAPGGNIMIHGIANGWGLLGRLHLGWDWTNGCIAITNEEMREVWSLVPNGTPITIVDSI